MTLIEFIIVVSLTANLVTAVALKYNIEAWYLQQKVPHWFPEYFCLLCFSFWTGLFTAMTISFFLPIPFYYVIFGSIATPTIVVMLQK